MAWGLQPRLHAERRIRGPAEEGIVKKETLWLRGPERERPRVGRWSPRAHRNGRLGRGRGPALGPRGGVEGPVRGEPEEKEICGPRRACLARTAPPGALGVPVIEGASRRASGAWAPVGAACRSWGLLRSPADERGAR
ncbi:hypothetical protein NDU88_004479 [Pleurodeles waltl]|uniref:Uncharacterized protein n=1 Tax=Pleurodeles waltl TaxID=8319 RepID=A0AAV7L6U9_PLEWA|nr:hypothetical protein NDU88_004479 [Pleurodeles waltl]